MITIDVRWRLSTKLLRPPFTALATSRIAPVWKFALLPSLSWSTCTESGCKSRQGMDTIDAKVEMDLQLKGPPAATLATRRLHGFLHSKLDVEATNHAGKN